MDNIIITFEDGTKKEYRRGIRLGEIIEDVAPDREIICGSMNNIILNHSEPITSDGILYLYGLNTSEGSRVYEKGLTFLFKVCALEVLGKDVTIKIMNSIDRGIFFEVSKKVTDEEVKKIKALMKEKVEKALTFERLETTVTDAANYFRQNKRYDKVKTLFYHKSKYVTLYKFDGVYSSFLGDLPHNSSVLKYFDLTLMLDKGLILSYPSMYDSKRMVKYTHHAQFFDNITEYLSWAKSLNISSIGELNDEIVNTRPGELINICEFVQNNRLQTIAKTIADNYPTTKIILLSGPSSSGKTTSAKQLAMYLKTLGLTPVPLSLDDYFLEREETPINENGKYDFESIRAIDIKLFNKQVEKLLNGHKVTLPTFNFLTGKKEYRRTLQMKDTDILIVEGLHALSSELLKDIPKKTKYSIYVSPLVYLNIDDDNRINLTDIRLLRRMVRDNRTRGYGPSDTLASWNEVRSGEESYVFAYQDCADIIFNTFLPYELSVLKVYALPLLHKVQPDDPGFMTAVRLITLLDKIIPLPSDDVPSISILREFIGKGYFE